MSMLLPVRIMIVSLAMTGMAVAQSEAGASVQAIVAFVNILDHEAVEAVEDSAGIDQARIATRLVDYLQAIGVLAQDIGDRMHAAITEDQLGRETFILYLADLLNWTDPLETRDPTEAESMLRRNYCGLVISEGSRPEGIEVQLLDNEDVGAMVRQFLDRFHCIVSGLRERYRLPVE